MTISLLKNSITEATTRQYGFAVYLYQTFCDYYGLDPYPSTQDKVHLTLKRYATWRLFCARGTSATVKSDIHAIQHHLSLHGIHSNVIHDYTPMKRLFQAARLKFPSQDKTSHGLSVKDFKKLIDQVKPDSINGCVFRAILSFAFATGMRGSEFLSDKVGFNQSKLKLSFLFRRDRLYIWQDPNHPEKHYGMCWFFSSKTNKQLKQEFATIPCCCNLGFCPIIDLQRLINQINNCKDETCLFTLANGNLVTKGNLRNFLKNAGEKVGLNPDRIGNHTTRKTCIMYSIKHGLPDTIVVQVGRWKDFNSIKPYIALGPMELLQARTRVHNNSRSDSDRFKLFLNDKSKDR